MIANRIRVLVLHTDPIARAGLAVALESSSDIEVVRDRPELSEAGPSRMERGPYSSTDVVVADYVSGLEAARRAQRQHSAARWPALVVVGGIDREWEIRTALESGVKGYLLAGHGVDVLIASVKAVHRGMRYLEPPVVERLAESVVLDRLTRREEDVLRLVVEGLCNKAIGSRLGIAVGTVKSHLKTIFGKLGVGSRTQAVVAVGRRGVLSLAADAKPLKGDRGSGRAPVRPDRLLRPSHSRARLAGVANATPKHYHEEHP